MTENESLCFVICDSQAIIHSAAFIGLFNVFDKTRHFVFLFLVSSIDLDKRAKELGYTNLMKQYYFLSQAHFDCIFHPLVHIYSYVLTENISVLEEKGLAKMLTTTKVSVSS